METAYLRLRNGCRMNIPLANLEVILYDSLKIFKFEWISL